MWKLSARTHIALGQTFLLTSLVLVAVMLGLVPDRLAAEREGRTALAETVAIYGSEMISRGELRSLEASLRTVVERNPDLLSVALRRRDGVALVRVGDHDRLWDLRSGEVSTDAQVAVPIFSVARRWGRLELSFVPLSTPGWIGLATSPSAKLIGFLALSSFILLSLYLRKMLKHLDPAQAVPPHVRSALDTLAEGLLVIDTRQQIVLANQAFSAIAGRTPDALMGRRASELSWLAPDGAQIPDAELPWVRALAVGELQRNDMIQLRDPEGQPRSFIVNSSPVLGSGGKFGGVLISLDDVTQLEANKLRLSEAKEEAEAASRAKSEFLANMSHEIRTPMNSILGFTEVLRRGYGNSEADRQKHLETIRSSGEHLLQLINDVLDLSKVEAGRLEVERIPFAPHQLIQEVMKVLSVKAREKNISLELEATGSVPETLCSDPTRLRQIVTNLVSNAVKFTDQGGVTVRFHLGGDLGGVDGNARGNGGKECRFFIEVADTGVGLPAEALDSIFDAFVQADSSVTREFGGTGLGLGISRSFARLLGGDIVVESTPGRGSTFTVTIDPGPLDEVRLLDANEALAAPEQLADEVLGAWHFPPACVLVVDDGDENRELVRLVLEEVGLNVEEAENGQIAVDKTLAQDFDLILMDMQMPVMDGYAAAARLREEGVETPIYALTANAMKGFEDKCLEAGCNGFITKPIDIDAMVATLAERLGGERLPGSAANTSWMPRSTASTIASQGPVLSRLASNPQLRPTLEKFVDRLGRKLEGIQTSFESRDFETVAELAHWLKGAAGTVGFDAFTDPAERLQERALAGQEEGIEESIEELFGLAERIALDPGASPAPIVAETVDPRATRAASPYAEAPVVSKFDGNQRLRPTLEKFVVRLMDKLETMDASLESRDFDALAELAHWLKGAAGTVGFDAFTAPAETLELLAKEQKSSDLEASLQEIRGLAERIVVAGG